VRGTFTEKAAKVWIFEKLSPTLFPVDFPEMGKFLFFDTSKHSKRVLISQSYKILLQQKCRYLNKIRA